MKLLVFLFMLSGSPLNVREAEAYVRLCETRVKIADIDVQRARLQRDYYREIVSRKERLHAVSAVASNDLLDYRLKLGLAELDVRQQVVEAEESQRVLELARLRLEREKVGK